MAVDSAHPDALFSNLLPAAPHIFPHLAVRLPAWLDALDPPARERIGRALDDRTVRLLLGDDGRALVVRSNRA
jgi:hypothetical protein